MRPVKIFLSYSHQDETFKNELVEFLAPMEGAGEIEVWHDREILVGDQWNDEIVNALNEAQIILFLISPSFLASTFINKIEILKAMERHRENQVRLVPIMVRNCALNSHVVKDEKYKIADFQGLPTNLKPVNNWTPRDDAWMNVIQGLQPVINKLKQSSN